MALGRLRAAARSPTATASPRRATATASPSGGAGPSVVLLDGLGTVVRLAPPGPLLVRALARRRRIELAPADAERAFRAEIAYYRSHHDEGRDEASVAELRRRCAEVLHAALPPPVAARISVEELVPAMLDALRFSAYPDAVAVLPLLRERGLRLFVVSNWDVSLEAVLRDTGLASVLDGVFTSAAVGRRKPAPEIFRAALARAAVAPEQAVHVGDSLEHDVAGAAAAGIAPVLLRRPETARGARDAGVATISSLAELPRRLT